MLEMFVQDLRLLGNQEVFLHPLFFLDIQSTKLHLLFLDEQTFLPHGTIFQSQRRFLRFVQDRLGHLCVVLLLEIKEVFDLLTSRLVFLFEDPPFVLQLFSSVLALSSFNMELLAVLFDPVLCEFLIKLNLVIHYKRASTNRSSRPFTQLQARPNLLLRCRFHFLFESCERIRNALFLVSRELSDFEAHLFLFIVDSAIIQRCYGAESGLLVSRTLGGHC